MRFRLAVWLSGLIVVGLGATLSAEARQPIVLLAELLVFALFGAIVEQLARLRRDEETPRVIPAQLKPADQTIEQAKMLGVRAEPNSIDPRFHKFIAIEPISDAPVRPARQIPAFLGRAAIVSVFIGRDGRAWSDKEIADAHKSIERAGRWIERQAAVWNAPINIEIADTYFDTIEQESEDIEIGFVLEPEGDAPMERHAETNALIEFSRTAARLGFADASAMTGEIEARIVADSVVWLIHERRAGRSFAVPRDEASLPGVAIAVCYASEANYPEPLDRLPYSDPITLTHEMFHLFGATDKYGASLSNFPKDLVTERDIMRLEYESLSKLKVDRLTALEIGWTDSQR